MTHIPKTAFHSSQSATAIISSLQEKGIVCTESRDNEFKTALIIWIENIQPDIILGHIRDLSCNNYMIIVINLNIEIADSIKWKFIAAGAKDVVDWQNAETTANIIIGRLRRWKIIEELLQSALVREKMIGDSQAWKSFTRKIIEVAYFTNANILLTGESGTGKELTAGLIHDMDQRKEKGKLVLVDCTTIVPELFGSEFYGHEKGAFTSGIYSREGAFALANNGSLFLDELGELPLTLQAGLLRVIQEKTYKKVGSNTWQKTNFRLVCATNKDLKAGISEGHFRKDLYYRIASSVFTMPTLDERREDIPELARYFLREELKTIVAPHIDTAAMNYLVSRDYPGNIRELKQLINRIAVRYTGENIITVGDIPEDELPMAENRKVTWDNKNLTMQQSIRLALSSGKDLAKIKNEIANLALETALEDCNGNLKFAARKLNVEVRTLQYIRRKNNSGIVN